MQDGSVLMPPPLDDSVVRLVLRDIGGPPSVATMEGWVSMRDVLLALQETVLHVHMASLQQALRTQTQAARTSQLLARTASALAAEAAAAKHITVSIAVAYIANDVRVVKHVPRMLIVFNTVTL